jgi:aspartate/methionine/tyrosine aminotransferase
MVNPPPADGPSYATYTAERAGIYGSLKSRATKLVTGLNKMDGITCNDTGGAMYAFPRVHLPAKAVAAAKTAGSEADAFYCPRRPGAVKRP